MAFLTDTKVEGVDIIYFNHLSGRDNYKHVAVQLVVGRVLPPVDEIYDRGGLIAGHYLPRPVDKDGKLRLPMTTGGVLRKNGSGAEVTYEVADHPAAQRALEQMREAQLLQGLGRPRPACRTAADPLVQIIMGTVPLSGIEADEVCTYGELMPRRALVALTRSSDGVLPLVPGLLARGFPEDLWESPDAARRDVEGKGGHNPPSSRSSTAGSTRRVVHLAPW